MDLIRTNLIDWVNFRSEIILDVKSTRNVLVKTKRRSPFKVTYLAFCFQALSVKGSSQNKI